MLELKDICVYYGIIQILKGVSLRVPTRSIVSIIGANGAGKSTLLRATSGLIPIVSGQVVFDGCDISRFSAQEIVRMGICQVLEGRQVFTSMTVRDNLELGAYTRYRRDRYREIQKNIESVNKIFPILKERSNQLAGTLSGGEQQMLAVGRALMGRPRLLLLDEPSLGLAPMIVKEILRVITKVKSEGVTIMLVEQRARLALEISDYAYVLELGKIVFEDEAIALLGNKQIRKAYLGEQD